MDGNIKNCTSVPLSIDRMRLTALGLQNSELELATALYQTYLMMPYTVAGGKPACVLGLSDIARYYNLPYQTIYAASSALLEKGIVEKISTKFVLTERFLIAMAEQTY